MVMMNHIIHNQTSLHVSVNNTMYIREGATGFLPYLTLHMQTLGITVKEIAVIYAFLPIASLLGPPISGKH